MMQYYFNIGLIYSIIGFAVAIYFVFILRKKLIGKFWGTLIIALVGSFLGGIIEFLFHDIITYLAHFRNSINLFPPFFTSLFVVWLFSRGDERK